MIEKYRKIKQLIDQYKDIKQEPIKSNDYAERAVKENPNNPDALNAYGATLYNLGQYEKSCGILDFAYNIKKNVSGICNNYELSLYHTGKIDKAKEIIVEAVNLAPGIPLIHENKKIIFGEATGDLQLILN